MQNVSEIMSALPGFIFQLWLHRRKRISPSKEGGTAKHWGGGNEEGSGERPGSSDLLLRGVSVTKPSF